MRIGHERRYRFDDHTVDRRCQSDGRTYRFGRIDRPRQSREDRGHGEHCTRLPGSRRAVGRALDRHIGPDTAHDDQLDGPFESAYAEKAKRRSRLLSIAFRRGAPLRDFGSRDPAGVRQEALLDFSADGELTVAALANGPEKRSGSHVGTTDHGVMTAVAIDMLDELAVHRPLVVDIAELGLDTTRRSRQHAPVERRQLALQCNPDSRWP